LPGWPLPSVSRIMPFTNASITVRIAITRVNATAVSTVIGQRTTRFRRLYLIGTLPIASMPSSTTITNAIGASKRGEIGKFSVIFGSQHFEVPSCHSREHFGYLHSARIPRWKDAAHESGRCPDRRPPPKGVLRNQERWEKSNRKLNSAHDVVEQIVHRP